MKKILMVMGKRGVYYTDLAESLYRSLKSNSIEVSVVELGSPFRSDLVGRIRNKFITSSINKDFFRRNNEDVISKIISEKPDIIFVIKGVYLLPETIINIKNIYPGVPVICFNPDDPFNTASSNKFIKDSLLLYDNYFIWSKVLTKRLKDYGIKNVHYFPFSLDKEIIYPVTLFDKNLSEYSSDVAFIGNGDKKRNNFLQDLVAYMEVKKINSSVRVYGSLIKGNRGLQIKKQVTGTNLLNAFAGAKINLNILREQNINSINMRTFEIPGTKSFMLHEYSEEAMEFFHPGVEAEYFRNSYECAEKIEYYLKNGSVREKIAEAGYNRIISGGFTYSDSVKKFLFPILI